MEHVLHDEINEYDAICFLPFVTQHLTLLISIRVMEATVLCIYHQKKPNISLNEVIQIEQMAYNAVHLDAFVVVYYCTVCCFWLLFFQSL